jgi:hypothetical protein
MKYNSMDALSAKIRNAHALCKDLPVTTRLSKDDDKAAAYAMYNDITSDLEAYRGMVAKLGAPKCEAIVKALIQNCADVKSMMDEEFANSK